MVGSTPIRFRHLFSNTWTQLCVMVLYPSPLKQGYSLIVATVGAIGLSWQHPGPSHFRGKELARTGSPSDDLTGVLAR
jgi:hypothetical protein